GDLGSRLHAVCAAFAVTHLTDVTTIAVWPNDEHMPHIRFADLFAVAKNSTGRSSTRRRREHEDSLWVRSVSWPIDHWRDHLEPTRETVSVPACSHGGAAGGIHSHAADSFELFFSPETNTWLKSDAMEACEYEQAVQACLASLHPSPAVAVTVERENLSRIRASHAVLPENGLDYSASGCVQQPGAAAGTCGMSQPSSPYLITPSRPDLGHEGRDGENEGTETAEAAEGESGYDAPFPLRATEARASRCRGNTRGGGGGRAGNGSLAGGRVGAMGSEDEHGGPEVDGALLGSVDGDAREGSGGATVDERLECTRLEVRAGGKEGVELVIELLFALSFAHALLPPRLRLTLFFLVPLILLSFLNPFSPPLFSSPLPPRLPLSPQLAELFALSFAHALRAPSPAPPLARFVAAQGVRRTRAFLLLPPPQGTITSLTGAQVSFTLSFSLPPSMHTDASRRQLQDSWSSSPDSSSTTDWSSPTPDSTSSSDWSSSPDTSSQWTAPADTSSDWSAPSDPSSSSDYSSPSPDWSATTTPSPPPPSDSSTDAGASNSDWVSNNDWQAPSSPSPPPPDWSVPSPPPPSESTGDTSSSGPLPSHSPLHSSPLASSPLPLFLSPLHSSPLELERYSWKPKQCGGNILRFQAAEFAQKMQNKVIALVGDSLITDGFLPSLLCQLAQVGTVSRVEGSALGSFVWRLDSHNMTVANYWSPFLMWTSANPVVIRKLRVQDPGLGDTAVNLGAFDPQWFDQVQTMDLIVFQSATHWPHAERWLRRFFVDRKWHRLDPEPDTMTAYKQALNKLAKSFNAGNSKRWDLPVPYFLSAPPRLVNCQGSYAPANRSTAFLELTHKNFHSPPSPCLGISEQYEHMVRGNPQSRKWFPAQRDILSPSKNIRFVDITHPSLYRSDAMLASQSPDSKDCLHPCLPGLPDIWVDLFYEVWKADPEFNS
ncbi:unnamed protein product, partial [Closterium sp. Naga37s-1]